MTVTPSLEIKLENLPEYFTTHTDDRFIPRELVMSDDVKSYELEIMGAVHGYKRCQTCGVLFHYKWKIGGMISTRPNDHCDTSTISVNSNAAELKHPLANVILDQP